MRKVDSNSIMSLICKFLISPVDRGKNTIFYKRKIEKSMKINLPS